MPQKRVLVTVAAELNTCWVCQKYYWEVYQLAQKDNSIGYMILTCALKDSEKQKLNQDLSYRWSENIVHIEDSELHRQVKTMRPKPDQNILVIKDKITYHFNGNQDINEMITLIR